jgi:FdhD/NarQ family
MTDGSIHRTAQRLTATGGEALDEIVAEEVAVALVYNGISHAVMMATPCDLEDFARGFSLTEHIVAKPSEIYDIEVEPVGRGIEVRLDIAAQRMAGLQQRRRTLAGRTGCGLCGVDSIEEPPPLRRCRARRSRRRWPPCPRTSASTRRTAPPTLRAGRGPTAPWWRCVRMSAATTRSTSWAARLPARGPWRPAASWW